MNTWREYQQEYLKNLIDHCKGNIFHMVRVSGIPRATVYRFVRKLSMNEYLMEIRSLNNLDAK